MQGFTELQTRYIKALRNKGFKLRQAEAEANLLHDNEYRSRALDYYRMNSSNTYDKAISILEEAAEAAG